MTDRKLREEILSVIDSAFPGYKENKEVEVQESVNAFIEDLKSIIKNTPKTKRPIHPPGTNGGSTSGDKKKVRRGEDKIKINK